MKFMKKLAAVTLAAIMAVSMMLSTVSATETFETPSGDTFTTNLTDYDVFEAIKVRRDYMNDTEKYLESDYHLLKHYLTSNHQLNIRYFTLGYDTQDSDLGYYKDPTVLDPTTVIYKSKIAVQTANLMKDGYIHMGWEYDGVTYSSGDYFTMPACDVTFTPVWQKRCKVNYSAGDYDDITGNTSAYVISVEGVTVYLANAQRFSRAGYTITGWTCSYDGQVYAPGAGYVVPDTDVTFEAVWTPASYPITISANNGVSTNKYTTTGVFGEEFVLPECEFTNEGKTFAGWKYNGTIYQPGESFTVPALLSGEKLVISATWS